MDFRRRLMSLFKTEEGEEMGAYRLINSVTIDETAKNIAITTDSDGNAFELDDFVLVVVGSCDQSATGAVHVILNGETFANAVLLPKTGTELSNYGSICYNTGMVVSAASALGSAGAVTAGGNDKQYVKKYFIDKLTSVSVETAAAECYIEAGATVTLYGR